MSKPETRLRFPRMKCRIFHAPISDGNLRVLSEVVEVGSDDLCFLHGASQFDLLTVEDLHGSAPHPLTLHDEAR